MTATALLREDLLAGGAFWSMLLMDFAWNLTISSTIVHPFFTVVSSNRQRLYRTLV